MFPVPIKVRNWQNRFLPPEEHGEEVACDALVDTGAVELPHGAKPLLGAVPLEEMDWHVSPQEKKLLHNPESPDGPLLPLC